MTKLPEYVSAILSMKGNWRIISEELRLALAAMKFDEYDKLIQLCDSLAAAEGVVDMKERMEDIRRRYGQYPQSKWDKNMELKTYFEQKAGKDIYTVVGGISAE